MPFCTQVPLPEPRSVTVHTVELAGPADEPILQCLRETWRRVEVVVVVVKPGGVGGASA